MFDLKSVGPIILSWLVLFSQIALVIYFFLFIFKIKIIHPINLCIKNNFIWISFIIALVAMSGSLFFSEVVGYTPCELCWYQRILMYSQVLLFGVALWRKDTHVFRYGIAFSGLGIIFSGYHYLLQLGFAPAVTDCAAVNTVNSCAKLFIINFGYMTIPSMALTAFVMIFLVQLIRWKYKHD